MTAHRWLIAAAAHAAFRRLALRGPLRLSLVARPPPTSCAWSSPPARSCATSNCSAARPPARPPSPPARLTPRILLARGRQSRHTTTSLPLTPPHDAQPVHSRRQGARNAQFGLEMPPPRVGGALGSGAAPRRANLRDKLATSVPRIHPRFCPIPAHQVPRAASRAKFLLHFRQVHPARTPIFGRLEAQDGARDRPGVDSPRRCGVSARPWRVQGCA